MAYKYVPRTTAALAMIVLQQSAYAQQPATGDTAEPAGMQRVQVTGDRKSVV